MKAYLRKSKRPTKKWAVTLDGVTIHFGQQGAPDYTTTNDEARKRAYLARHRSRENWSKSGKKTAGFWSRYLLWNAKTIEKSKKYITARFGIKFV